MAPRSILNTAQTPPTDTEGDGVALTSTAHPATPMPSGIKGWILWLRWKQYPVIRWFLPAIRRGSLRKVKIEIRQH